MMPARIAATLPTKVIKSSREPPGLHDRGSLSGTVTGGPYQHNPVGWPDQLVIELQAPWIVDEQ
jgi:hypothetical protein